MTSGLILRTAVVQGRLAYAMRRAAAARSNEHGLQILTLPQLAARLAGGLKRPASRESIEAGIIAALGTPERFEELAPVCEMPGMIRALDRTLQKIWRSGFDLRGSRYRNLPRVRDLAYIEDVIRETLQPGENLLPDLEQLARSQIDTAEAVLGSITIDGVHGVDPLWRPLLNELRAHVKLVWQAPAGASTDWFLGDIEITEVSRPEEWAFGCATPGHEALEAMRWARSLIASGTAKPHEIAIAATSTAAWDDEFAALATSSKLPISFVSGRPALTTWDGQRCAALADVLHNGLSQARIRRLLSVCRGQSKFLEDLPNGSLPVPGQASLTTADDWDRALRPHPQHASVLVPLLRELEQGPDAALKAGEMLLARGALALWNEALRRAPASALMFTLESLRVPDDRDSAGSIAWCSAEQLAGAPRPFVWLLGLTSTDWPRTGGVDPLLPGYLVPATEVDPDPVENMDRRCFRIIKGAARQVMLSSARLSSQGTKASASALLPAKVTTLYRDRTPRHAFSESDRLLARQMDIEGDPLAARAAASWTDWNRRNLTPHDGMIGQPHPMLAELLARPQSPTSLSLLLRDPLVYVWYYALGWRDLVHKERALTLPADDYGRLVHELLRRAVDHLEPRPGFPSANRHEIEEALDIAEAAIVADWPAHTDVPPPVLWVNTVRQAREMGLLALTRNPFEQAGVRSWTEVPFGGEVREPTSLIDLPWDHALPVVIPGTDVRIVGSIDRLDLWPGSVEVHVTDYKTGQRPKKPEERVLAGGQELQRALYDLACRTLLEEEARRVVRLMYLRAPVSEYILKDPDAAIEKLGRWVALARSALEAGTIYTGVKSLEDDPRFGRLAMPAASFYRDRKNLAIRDAAGRDLSGFCKEK